MQFRVDTNGMTFIVGGIRGVMDFETKIPVLDKSSTTGMRRPELAGVGTEDLDLDAGTLRVADTRVVVGGRTVDSDGKTDRVRTLSLDPATIGAVAALPERHLSDLRAPIDWA